jgi:putative transposase
LTKEKFDWQDEYFAVSVSESIIDKVREYIKNQEEHHSKKTFQKEYDEFIRKYGFDKLKDNILAKANNENEIICPPAKAGGNQ